MLLHPTNRLPGSPASVSRNGRGSSIVQREGTTAAYRPFCAVHPSMPGYWGITKESDNTYKDTVCETFIMDSEWTSSLVGGRCHEVLRTDVVDVLLTSVLRAFSSSFLDRDTLQYTWRATDVSQWDDSIDISSTVGWFTTMEPSPCARRTTIGDTPADTPEDQGYPPTNTEKWVVILRLTLPQPVGQEVFADTTLAEVVFNSCGPVSTAGKSRWSFRGTR